MSSKIDLTLFDACEAARRLAFSKRYGDIPKTRVIRANQICKLYNSVVQNPKLEEVVNDAAESIVAFSDDPNNPAQLVRVLLHPAVSAPSAGGVNVSSNISGGNNRIAGRNYYEGVTNVNTEECLVEEGDRALDQFEGCANINIRGGRVAGRNFIYNGRVIKPGSKPKQ